MKLLTIDIKFVLGLIMMGACFIAAFVAIPKIKKDNEKEREKKKRFEEWRYGRQPSKEIESEWKQYKKKK